MAGAAIIDGIREMDALLLGRRTADIFTAYWPQHDDTEVGRILNGLPKYIASHDPGLALDWNGSTRVGDDLASEISELRDRHRETHVIGSIDLVQTLLTGSLFDELRLWVYPVVLGSGKRVFPEGAAPANLRLIAPPLSGSVGAVLLRYAPGPGLTETGIMGG